MAAIDDFNAVAGGIQQKKAEMQQATFDAEGNLQQGKHAFLAGEGAAQRMHEQAQLGSGQGHDMRMQMGRIAAADQLAGKARAHEMTLAGQQNEFNTAADHRKTGAAALLAGADPNVVNQALNASPGFQVNYSGVKVPQKLDQQRLEQVKPEIDATGNIVAPRGAFNPATGEYTFPGAGPGVQPQQSQAAAALSGSKGPAASAPGQIGSAFGASGTPINQDVDFHRGLLGQAKTPEEFDAHMLGLARSNPAVYDAIINSARARRQ